MEKPVRIYVLEDPTTGQVFYVGKTELKLNTRLRCHICDALAGRSSAAEEIKRVIGAGNRPTIREIQLVPAGDDWIDAEQRWICHYREAGSISNRTVGGQGVSGVLRTAEWLRRIVESRRVSGKGAEGSKRAAEKNRGRVQPEEERKRRSKSQLGRKHTPETKAKISASHMGMSHPPEVIERIAAKKRGVPLTEAHKKKIGLAGKARAAITSKEVTAKWNDPECRERMLRKRWATNERKRKEAATKA